ncbi:DUF2066 domain-containing protein [Hyphomicrobium sp. CS1GBMeth3]|uniref:DUF2066 domain-containing protein n=1 Tax=Hyphomicrobium sp. CS1GBMeth3 TaxID=1892845 RepID=UPI0009314759|nr:DUF2066 domain-containing protein [Hyphomicrobium sp. CS1GBMeth3]
MIVSLAPGLLLALSMGVSGPVAAASSKVFTVANYPVEATAKDAVAAKEKAHAEGQQAAFGALLKRIVPVTAYNRIDHIKSIPAANLVDGVAVRSETNSRTQYIASLDFSFQADAVRDLLSRQGVPFVEDQAPRMVVVPITAESAEGKTSYRPASGAWAQVWKGLDLDNTLTPLRIEALRPTIHEDTVVAALNGDDSVERILTGEYKVDFVLLAIAEVDKASGVLNVSIAGIDGAGLVAWRRGYRIENGDVGYAMEFAAVVTQGVLEGRWKVAKLEDRGGGGFAYSVGGGAGGSEVRMAVEYGSIGEWDDLRRVILDTPGIDDVRIGSVSDTSAEVSVRFPGGADQLASVLSRQGLVLSGGGGYWTLRAGY